MSEDGGTRDRGHEDWDIVRRFVEASQDCIWILTPDGHVDYINPRGEALLELAPNVLLTEPRSSQAHLDALAALVEASACYRLATGRDLDGAVRLLEGIVDGLPPA